MRPLPNHIRQIQPPPITEVKSWLRQIPEAQQQSLIDLCQAIPDYPPPRGLVEHLKTALDDPQTFKYSPDEGVAEVREEVSRWYRRHYQAAPQAEQICLTIGASQAFWLATTVLCQPGDEIIVQLPAYFDHPMGLQAQGVTPVYAPFNEGNSGLPDIGELEKLITTKTRAILLVTPSNPTGANIPAEQLDELFELCKQQGIALLLDETYNAFVDSPPHNLFGSNDWPETLIHLASFGKTFALTGLRCGALIAAEEFIEQALKIQDSMTVCQPRPAQAALTYGCKHLDSWLQQNRSMMQKRHDLFRQAFEQSSSAFQCTASGSFFAWMKHPWKELSGRQAAYKLLNEAGLLSLPGEAFGPGMDRYLRLALGNINEEQIPEAIDRLARIR